MSIGDVWDKLTNKKEKDLKDQIREEAKREALEEIKPILKEQYKQEEIKKITGEARKEKLDKLANAFGKMQSKSDNIVEKIGKPNNPGVKVDPKSKQVTSEKKVEIGTDEQLNYMLGKSPKKEETDFDKKLKNMLGK